MPNLVKYFVGFAFLYCFSLFLSCWVRLRLHQSLPGWWIPQRGCCPAHNNWYQSIPGWSWSVLIPRASVAVWQRTCVDLRATLGQFVGSCVISKQRVDCSRNQFRGVDCFGNSSRVSRGGKDPIFIQFVLSNSVCFRIALRNQLRRWLEKVRHRENP